MSFSIMLNGSLAHGHPEKSCQRCEEPRHPSGGIELGPGRWICSRCWIKKVNMKVTNENTQRTARNPGQ